MTSQSQTIERAKRRYRIPILKTYHGRVIYAYPMDDEAYEFIMATNAMEALRAYQERYPTMAPKIKLEHLHVDIATSDWQSVQNVPFNFGGIKINGG